MTASVPAENRRELPFDVVLGHVLGRGGREALREAFAWLS